MSTTTTSYRSVVGISPSPLLLALLQGVLPADADLWSAQAILDATLHLTEAEAEAAQVADEVLQIAADRTLGQIRSLAQRLALRIKPKER